MKRDNVLLRLLRSVVIIDLVAVVAVGLACWFGGWRTLYQYGAGLTLAGIVIIGLGILFVTMAWQGSRSFHQLYGESMSEDSMVERVKRTQRYLLRNYASLIQLTAAGLVLLVLGAVIQTVTR